MAAAGYPIPVCVMAAKPHREPPVSEETGKISIAKDGTLIADVNEETLKKILIKSIITNRTSDKDKKPNIIWGKIKKDKNK